MSRARRTQQRQKHLRARVALALYCVNGHVPRETEIDQAYQLIKTLNEETSKIQAESIEGMQVQKHGQAELF